MTEILGFKANVVARSLIQLSDGPYGQWKGLKSDQTGCEDEKQSLGKSKGVESPIDEACKL